MNHHDPFEQRLRRQPLRAIPPDWREEILVAAEAQRRAAPVRQASRLAAWRLRWRELFWPAPQAWAGLAAVWLVILGMNLATPEPAPQRLAHRAAPATPQTRELLKEQQLLFAELIGPVARPRAERPKTPALQPRSQRREEFLNA